MKRGDIFKREGDSETFVIVSPIYDDGSFTTIYRNERCGVIYAGMKVQDCKGVETFGSIIEYLPSDPDNRNIEHNIIMKLAEKQL